VAAQSAAGWPPRSAADFNRLPWKRGQRNPLKKCDQERTDAMEQTGQYSPSSKYASPDSTRRSPLVQALFRRPTRRGKWARAALVKNPTTLHPPCPTGWSLN